VALRALYHAHVLWCEHRRHVVVRSADGGGLVEYYLCDRGITMRYAAESKDGTCEYGKRPCDPPSCRSASHAYSPLVSKPGRICAGTDWPQV
jgi:hypothetical protein